MNLLRSTLAVWLCLLGLMGFTGTGCKTTDSAHTGNLASVEIIGRQATEIHKAVAKAFQDHGYTQVNATTFERKGSAMDTVADGGWSTDKVWIRVRLELITTSLNQYTLGCDAYVVQNHHEIGIETEQKFAFKKRSECKAILDEAKAALDALPPAAKSGR